MEKVSESSKTVEIQQTEEEDLVIIEDPFQSSVEFEHALMEVDESYGTIIDFLYEVWNEKCSGTRNLRVLLAFLSKYLINHHKDNPSTQRMQEAHQMKLIITEFYLHWCKNGTVKPNCYREDLHDFIESISTRSLTTAISNGLLSDETFNEWISDYNAYSKSLFKNEVDNFTMTDTTDYGQNQVETTKEEEEEEEEEKEEGALDALFNSSAFQKEEQDAQMSQFITKKSDSGLLCTLKTPADIEFNGQLVRLDLYDIKDILRKDKRQWWKSAKLRSQFLIPSSSMDRKHKLLRQLLDCTANDLKKLPGAKRESRSSNFDAGTSS